MSILKLHELVGGYDNARSETIIVTNKITLQRYLVFDTDWSGYLAFEIDQNGVKGKMTTLGYYRDDFELPNVDDPKLETDELSIALEIQARHKHLREESGISDSLRIDIEELSHPNAYKKHFKKDDEENGSSENKLNIAIEALKELQLSHEHNESNPDYRPLGNTYGWCSACSTKVGLNEDIAKEALIKIQEEK